MTAPTMLPWRHDLAGCLHAVIATLLHGEGVDPDHVLGAGWSFWYRNGDVAPAEYYFPTRPGSSLVEAVAPESGVVSTWHAPQDSAWADLAAEIAAGHLVAAAVDNFHLPFRPAFHDVHANHMIVVASVDQVREVAHVMDRVPPAFTGLIRFADLARARGSHNPADHDRDMFFTGHSIDNRWLSVRRVGPGLTWDLPVVLDVIGRNVDGYFESSPTGEYVGLSGLRDFLVSRSAPSADADELFIVAGTALASTAVHADWLRSAALDFDRPDLAEAAREVDLVAHHWSAVRILTAMSREDSSMHIRLRRRVDRLIRAYDDAILLLSSTLGSPDPGRLS